MDASAITNLFKAIIDPLVEKLASKDDIDTFVKFIDGKFKDELKIRDDKIEVLESKNAELESRISAIELGLKGHQSTVVEQQLPYDQFDCTFPDRSDVEEARPELDLLVIGDSNVRFLKTDEINPGKSSKIDCTGGGKLHHIRENLIKQHEAYDIRNAVIHVGSNHIPTDRPIDVARKLESFLKAVKLAMPNTFLHFSAILPKLSNSYLPGINYVNEHIFNVCRSLHIAFIQYPGFAQNGLTNPSLFGRDRIHTNPRGQAIMSKHIKIALNN